MQNLTELLMMQQQPRGGYKDFSSQVFIT
jgi:hypothetical protein